MALSAWGSPWGRSNATAAACLPGLATGDALGTTLEFRALGSFAPIDDMAGGGPCGLRLGQWTDDTSITLCLAEGLIGRHGFDPVDQLQRYLRWYREGHLSSTERCFDIGEQPAAHWRALSAPASPIPALPTRARRATARLCVWRQCRSLMPATPARRLTGQVLTSPVRMA